jgi:taurine dioxygenase
MRVEVLSGAGVLVSDLSLDQDPRPEEKDRLRQAFRDRHLLVYRDQDLSPERQAEVTGWFGPVRSSATGSVGYVSNVRPDGLVPEGPLPFHSDMSFTEHPLLGISLHALEIPSQGASTMFANAVAAVDRLPDELRSALAGRQILNIAGYGANFSTRRRAWECDPVEPRAEHPAIDIHPLSGRPVLRINSLSTSHLVGMELEASESVIQQVFDVLYDPANIYEHHWQVGDLIIFDNIAVHHARRDFDSAERRTLQRVVLDNHGPTQVLPELAALYREAQELAGHGPLRDPQR